MDWTWAYHAQQGMVKKSDIFTLFRDWWDINIRSVAFCIIIPIFLDLCLVDYFMHTLFMEITYNLFDCNFMLPLHHQCKLLHGQHPWMDLHDLWVGPTLMKFATSMTRCRSRAYRDSSWCTSDELRWFCTLSNSLMNVRKSGAASMYNAIESVSSYISDKQPPPASTIDCCFHETDPSNKMYK